MPPMTPTRRPACGTRGVHRGPARAQDRTPPIPLAAPPCMPAPEPRRDPTRQILLALLVPVLATGLIYVAVVALDRLSRPHPVEISFRDAAAFALHLGGRWLERGDAPAQDRIRSLSKELEPHYVLAYEAGILEARPKRPGRPTLRFQDGGVRIVHRDGRIEPYPGGLEGLLERVPVFRDAYERQGFGK